MTDDEDGQWRDLGFDHATQKSFQEWKIAASTAAGWRAVGVTDGLTAVRWQLAGATPSTISGWQAAGIDSLEALQWHQTGHDLTQAIEAKQRGLKPSTAARGSVGTSRVYSGRSLLPHLKSIAGGPVGPAFAAWLDDSTPQHQLIFRYAQAHWVGDDALPWARAGVEPDQARLWNLLSVTASEAAVLSKQGVTALDVIRQWWAAGIPLQDVASWLGAGFTPEEAQQQIDAGVDVEQAAVLRALRDQPED